MDCCNGGTYDGTELDSECWPLNVTGDPFFESFDVDCRQFIRSSREIDNQGGTFLYY